LKEDTPAELVIVKLQDSGNTHVCCQEKRANTCDPQADVFRAMPAMRVHLVGHPPHQSSARNDLNQ
jgi:hypothetical protein